MRDRQKSLQRLLSVKSQLHRLEEARLIDIQRRKNALAEEKRVMFDLLAKDDKTDGLTLGLTSRHIVAIGKGERELDAVERAQRQVLLRRTEQKSLLEKILRQTDLALHRDAERKTLLDLGESLAARSRTSLG